MVNLTAHSLFSTVEHKFSVFNDLCGKVMISKIEEVTKMNKRKKTGMHLGKVMCKFAETFAPQASGLCRVQYYQPKEPDNMKLFVAKCQGKNV